MARKKFLQKKNASRLLTYPVDQKCRSILLRFRDKHVSAFNTEIKDGCQMWRKNDFCKKSPVDFADTLWVKNFVEIALSRSVSEKNVFLRLTQKFKMAAKNGGGKQFLRIVASRLCR